jgi:hypothetical protein
MHLLILPPWPRQWSEGSHDARPYHPHPTVAVIETRPNFYGDDNNDEDDDLSLYLGVENICYSNEIEFLSYRDMSLVSCNDMAIVVMNPHAQNNFPVLLHQLLSSARYNDSITWLPHGRAFVITNKANFCANVSPLVFHTNLYEDCIDWLEKYGFQQVQLHNGPGNDPLVLFYHEVR